MEGEAEGAAWAGRLLPSGGNELNVDGVALGTVATSKCVHPNTLMHFRKMYDGRLRFC